MPAELSAHPIGEAKRHSQSPKPRSGHGTSFPCDLHSDLACKIRRYGIEIKAVHVPMAALGSLAVEAKRGRLIRRSEQ